MSIIAKDIVRINLTDRSIKREKCDMEIVESFLVGRGIGTYFLLENVKKGVHAFDPENVLVFNSGLLINSPMISSSRIHVCTRSPISGFIGTSNGGGFVANEMSLCNIYALIIEGKADKPVSINIIDEKIEIIETPELWGLSTIEATNEYKNILGNSKAHIISIGQAGENLVKFSSIMTGIGHFAGRTGTGAVMGSKNLKAISFYSVNRNGSASRYNSDRSKKAVKEYIQTISSTKFYKNYSTVGSTYLVSWADGKGAGSAKNYRNTSYKDIESTAWASNTENITEYKGCYKCPIKCKAEIKIDQGRHKNKVMERPDFEPLVSWGARSGNNDGRESVYLHSLCNDFGVDTIDAGNAVSFAIDLFEREILTLEDTNGIKLNWGNIESMERLLNEIVYRSSWLGDLLANGIHSAAKIIGKGAEKYAYHVKGLSIGAMDPRGFKATALGYAVSSRGSDFTYVYAKAEYCISPEFAMEKYGTKKASDRLSEEGKALMVRKSLVLNAIIDSLGLCKIPHLSMMFDVNLEIITKLINDIIGTDFTTESLFKVGERIVNAERIFNFRFGATRMDDRLPEKFTTEPIEEGLSKGSFVDLDKMVSEFYELMEWNEDGSVTSSKLRELELEKYVSCNN